QDSIEAVNGTLGHVVDRLAMIESGLRNQGLPKTPAVPPRPVLPTRSAPMEPPIGAVTLDAPPPTATGNPTPATDQERRPSDPTLPPDHPLEPGAGVNRGHGNSPADRIAASEAALGPAKPPVIPDPAGKS